MAWIASILKISFLETTGGANEIGRRGAADQQRAGPGARRRPEGSLIS
jgi:hypothetical protein